MRSFESQCLHFAFAECPVLAGLSRDDLRLRFGAVRLDRAGEAPERSYMPLGKKLSHLLNFQRFHGPPAVLASRFSIQNARALLMLLKLLADLVGDQIGLGHKYPKWFAGFLPATKPFDLPLVGHSNH